MRLFKYLSPEEGSGSAATPGGSQGASGKQGSPNAEGTVTAAAPGQNKSMEQLEAENRYLTREAFQGINAASKREFKELLAQSTAEYKSQIDALQKAVEGAISQKGKSEKTEDTKAEALELADLRKEKKEFAEWKLKMEQALESEKKKARDQKFEQMVRDALVRQKCTHPDKVFRMISPELKFSEDGTRIEAQVRSEFGNADVNVDEYIKRVTMEELPQLFEGGTRSGSPAGGDAGKAGKYLFTLSQLKKNPELYVKEADKVRQAFENKLVDLNH